MTLDNTSTYSGAESSTLTAMFNSRHDAEKAVDRLVEAGIPQSSVRLVPGYENDAPITDEHEVHRGFWGALSDFFLADDDRYSYAEGLKRGGFLVTVSNLPAGTYDTALDILDDEGSINLDEEQENWKSEGWSGYDSNATGYGSTYTDGTTATTSTLAGATLGSDLAAATYAGTTEDIADTTYDRNAASLSAADEDVIPVVEEQLKVGKRDVSHGRVRVRSYVREEPVSADVSLRDERVTLERRPVDRAVSATDVAFQDRTIEAEERAEEAVIQKDARVVEEIALRKDVNQQTQTINDTVKKTEVEVEDERGNIDRTGTTGTTWSGGTTR